MQFHNATQLNNDRLRALFERHSAPYRHDQLVVRVRYSRGADFSGTCYYREGRIFVNLGAHLQYPYRVATHVAKAKSVPGYWFRDTYFLTLRDAYQLVLFVYLHEFYHYLVKRAGRNPRRKESMCDRFATRVLVDEHRVRLTDSRNGVPERSSWDFRDVHRFVAKAPKVTTPAPTAPPSAPSARPVPVRILGRPPSAARR
jgi:hypothetical protein